jgi:hypothetical protein
LGAVSSAQNGRDGRKDAGWHELAVSGLAAFGIRVAEADIQFHWRIASI